MHDGNAAAPDASLLRKLDALVSGPGPFLHLTHVNPDADGFGSALAMSRWLRSLGKRSEVLVPSPIPRRLAFLHGPGEVEVGTKDTRLPDDAVVMLYDVSTPSRFGVLEGALRATRASLVVFDHHDGDQEMEALSFVDEGAGATAQVVYEILTAHGVPMRPELALPLYVALLSDTGSFNYGKTTPRTHEIAAELIRAGVRPLDVHGRLEGSRSLAGLHALGDIMREVIVDADDPRIAHAVLHAECLVNGASEPLDSGELVNATISLEGVVAGFLLIEAEPAVTRLSMRSKGDISVLATARSFGGGGHVNAAGATIREPLSAVRPRVLARLRADLAAQAGPPRG